MPENFLRIRSLAMAILAVIICVGAGQGCKQLLPGNKGMKVTSVRGPEHLMVKIKEGGLASADEYAVVKLQGYKAAERSPFASEGYKWLKDNLEGKYVILEYDGEGAAWTARDEMLAYVFIDGRFVQEELVRQGLGRFSGEWGPARFVEELRRAESQAREAGLGIWSEKVEENDDGDDDYYEEEE